MARLIRGAQVPCGSVVAVLFRLQVLLCELSMVVVLLCLFALYVACRLEGAVRICLLLGRRCGLGSFDELRFPLAVDSRRLFAVAAGEVGVALQGVLTFGSSSLRPSRLVGRRSASGATDGLDASGGLSADNEACGTGTRRRPDAVQRQR